MKPPILIRSHGLMTFASRERLPRKQLQWVDRARQAEDRYAQAVKLYLENNKEQALTEVNKALELRPTYLEALRLKEKIIKETNPQAAAKINSVMQDKVEHKDFEKWLRR